MELTSEMISVAVYVVGATIWIEKRLRSGDERSDSKDEKLREELMEELKDLREYLCAKIEGVGKSHDTLDEKFQKHEKDQIQSLTEIVAHMDGLMQFREECKRDFEIIKTQLADFSKESHDSRQATQGVLKMILEELRKQKESK